MKIQPSSVLDMDEIHQIRKRIIQIQKNQHSFVLWQQPEHRTKHLVVSHQCQSWDQKEFTALPPGFLVAPFSLHKNHFFFPADQYEQFSAHHTHNSTNNNKKVEPISEPNFFYDTNPLLNPLPTYSELVTLALQKIQQEEFEKVVLSQFFDYPIPEQFDLISLFYTLCRHFSTAFISLLSSPQTGTWITASPELFIQVNAQGIFKTVALAGTQPITQSDVSSTSWTQKEIEEQAMVTRYIINCFKHLRVREYIEHGPQTIAHGRLAHLQTQFTVHLNTLSFPSFVSRFAHLLHPTSAVCGMPREPALSFILKQEGYDRQLYTGYLGPVNIDHTIDLYVNLRCAQYFPRHLRLYAGAGITSHSDPIQETKEIQLKMESFLSLLHTT